MSAEARGRDPLVLAVAQPATVSGAVAVNAEEHAAAVRRAGARVVVFPEASLTGYELTGPALDPGDPRLDVLVEACAASRTLALAGALVLDGGRRFLAVLAVDGSGSGVAYRKQYLGDAERRTVDPGPAPAVVAVGGWRLGLAVCRDMGVAAHARDTAASGMDVYCAGVLEHAADAEVVEARVRRVVGDLGVWVAVASFAGSTGGGYASALGRSRVWDPAGRVVVAAGGGPGEVAAVRLADSGTTTAAGRAGVP